MFDFRVLGSRDILLCFTFITNCPAHPVKRNRMFTCSTYSTCIFYRMVQYNPHSLWNLPMLKLEKNSLPFQLEATTAVCTVLRWQKVYKL